MEEEISIRQGLLPYNPGGSHQVERWRVQEKLKEVEEDQENEEQAKKKWEKELVDDVLGVHQKPFFDESEERQKGEGKQKN